ncbi:hypothetical protein C5C86_05905 [Rathayibacter sp. AY1E4]|uniref:hypothetical protein n=1 Tax=Rathayibacter sp. AY1E4 TaxID=2080552 RepID=UPI000CE73369|nr:hypothetical protein [Rathayibacter sp. AY1E4]PPH41941.1 hypothetical protein C5C86_05905 [Rathayibacter sp. AY1E4]
MEITRVSIDLPERDTYGEMMKSFLTLMRAFGMELAAICESSLTPKLGNWWFQKLMQQRLDEKRIRGQQQDPRDAVIVLNEIAREFVSPIHAALPPSASTIRSAKTIVAKRNELLHFSAEASIEDIGEVAHLIQGFARHYNMKTDGAIVPLLTRLHKLKRGQYVPTQVTPPNPAIPSHQAQPPVELTSDVDIVDIPRPKIGGIWPGEVPAGQFKVTKTGDLVSVKTGNSLRDRIQGDAAWKLRAWLAPNPKGELWIASDGAVGGYVAAVPRLLGYLGQEPPGEIARGFLFPQYFEAVGPQVRDIGTGVFHQLPPKVTVVDGELLRLTTYGDLIRIDDDGVNRVAIVETNKWK